MSNKNLIQNADLNNECKDLIYYEFRDEQRNRDIPRQTSNV